MKGINLKLISFFYLTILLLSFLFLITNCSEENTSQPPPLVNETYNGFESFEVAKIFAENCTESGCHGGTEPVHLPHKEALLQTHSGHTDIGSIHSPSIVLLHFHLKYYEDVLISTVLPSNELTIQGVHYLHSKEV